MGYTLLFKTTLIKKTTHPNFGYKHPNFLSVKNLQTLVLFLFFSKKIKIKEKPIKNQIFISFN
ncbi:MAG: hypothetical protein CMH73_05670 [Nitrospina sp.]|nr:hypothetical protein [Nitrospina sp.]